MGMANTETSLQNALTDIVTAVNSWLKMLADPAYDPSKLLPMLDIGARHLQMLADSYRNAKQFNSANNI